MRNNRNQTKSNSFTSNFVFNTALNMIFSLPNSQKKKKKNLCHRSNHNEFHNPQRRTLHSGLSLKRTKSKMARLMTHKYLAGELTFITGRQRVN